MITEQELEAAIRNYEGNFDPDAPLCRNLAALYVIRDHLFGSEPQSRTAYSTVSRRMAEPVRVEDSDSADGSEFLTLAVTVDVDTLLDIMDELMADIEIMSPKLYRGVLRRLRQYT